MATITLGGCSGSGSSGTGGSAKPEKLPYKIVGPSSNLPSKPMQPKGIATYKTAIKDQKKKLFTKR